MKIIASDYNQQKKLSFSGQRTDKNLVNELTKDGGALFKPKQHAISDAIVRLSLDGSNENIEFLFSVAENLNYGMKKDSEISSFINNNSYVTNVPKKMNNDWEEKLKNAIFSAIQKNKTPQASEYKEKYDSMFGDENKAGLAKSVVNSPVAAQIQRQKELISLRNDILKSDVVENVPEGFNEKQTVDFNKDKRMLLKNIDYFVASSEISLGEKLECLKILKHMTTDEYKINPQLKDYKLKAISEILTDIVTESPNQTKLLTKEIAQGKYGRCAGFAGTRKYLAHEHKLAFVSTVAAELDDQSDIEIFDVTSKDFSEKVRIKKADINYKQFLDEDSRITDSAVDNWMKNGDNYGDGTKGYAWYKGYDREHYGVLKDAHYNNDLEGDLKAKQYSIRALIRLDAKGKEIEKMKQDYKNAVSEKGSVNEYFVSTSNKTFYATKEILKAVGVNSDSEAKEIARKMLDDKYLHSVNKPFISQHSDKEALDNAKAVIAELVGCKTNPNLDRVAQKYINYYSELASAKAAKFDNEKKLNIHSTENLQKLFDYAAYTRVKVEFDLELSEKREEYAKKFNVSMFASEEETKAQILKKMENQGLILKRKDLDEMWDKIAEKINNEKRFMHYGDRRTEKAAHKVSQNHSIATPAQLEMLKKVDRNFEQTFKELKKEYKYETEHLPAELEKQYEEYKYGGRPWVGEEGHSGLNRSQQLRNAEALTGQAHYAEENVSEAFDYIEKGKSGGVLSSSVCDNEAAFHAQYIYDVDAKDTKTIKDPQICKNKNQEVKKDIQRVLYTDNSWGGSEKRAFSNKGQGKTFWKDGEGNLRTDYGRNLGSEFGDKGGFGYRQGFFLDENYTIGVTEDDMTTGKVVFKNKSSGGKEKEIEMPLFSDIILKGKKSVDSDFDALLFRDNLFAVISQRSARDVNNLVSEIRTGNYEDIFNLSTELTQHIATRIYSYTEKKDSEIKPALLEDINVILAATPSRIFKKDENGVVRIDKFAEKLTNSLYQIVLDAKNSDEDKVKVECMASNAAAQVIDEIVEAKTTPIRVPNYNALESIRSSFSTDYENFIKKIGIINSREKYEALNDNDKLKLTIQKAALFDMMFGMQKYVLSENSKIANAMGENNVDYDTSKERITKQNREGKIKGLSLGDVRKIGDKIVLAKTSSDLSVLKNDFRKILEDQILLGFDKALLEKTKLTPKTFAALEKGVSGGHVTAFIDKKYNPSSDEEAMEIYNRILEMPKDEQEKLVRGAKDFEIGFKEPDYALFAKRINGGTEKDIKDSVQSVFCYEKLAKNFDLKSPLDKGSSEVDRLFLSLSNAVAYAEIASWINSNKAMAKKTFNAYSAMPMVQPFSEKEIQEHNKTMVGQIKEVALKINDFKNDKSAKTAAEIKANAEEIEYGKKALRDKIKIITNGCIQERYVDVVNTEVKNYVSILANNSADFQKTKEAEEKLLETMSKYHITRKPKELFQSFVNDVTEQSDYGNESIRDNVLSIKSLFLAGICEASDKTKLEFSMTMATMDGKMPAIARDMKDSSKLGLAKVGKKETMPWNDPESLKLVIPKLADKKNNNSTLKQFLLSTGMLKDAVKGLTTTKPIKVLFRISQAQKTYNEIIDAQKDIVNKTEQWKKSSGLTQQELETADFEEVSDVIDKYLQAIKPSKGSKAEATYDEFAKELRNHLGMKEYGGISATALDCINETCEDLTQKEELIKEDLIEKILFYQRVLGENISMLEEVSSLLDTGDEQKIIADKYITDATDAVRKLEDTKNVFQNEILERVTKLIDSQKVEAKRKEKALEAVQNSQKIIKSDLMVDEEALKKDADGLYSIFLKAQMSKNSEEIQRACYIVINSDNPELTKLLVNTMNDEKSSEMAKAFAVRCLIEKKEFEPLQEYLTQRLEGHDGSKLDATAVNCVDGMVVASLLVDGDKKQQYLELIQKAFELACDKDCQEDTVITMMEELRNSLSNKSPEINEMLLKYVFDKKATENQKVVSLDILGRSKSCEFKSLMEDVIANTGKYANSPEEAFSLFDVALLGLKNIRLMNPALPINIKEDLKSMDLRKIIEEGMIGSDEEAKETKEWAFLVRIDYILSDDPLKKYNENQKKREKDDNEHIEKNPIAALGKIDPLIEYMTYKGQYEL